VRAQEIVMSKNKVGLVCGTAVKGNPLENIEVLEDVRFVMLGGGIVRNSQD
jgi:hypothetical protein